MKYTIFTDDEVNILTREDWDLTLEVQEVTPTGITLSCTQTGGQLIGQLQARHYVLDSINERKTLTQGANEVDIAGNAATLYTLDWSETCGTLPS